MWDFVRGAYIYKLRANHGAAALGAAALRKLAPSSREELLLPLRLFRKTARVLWARPFHASQINRGSTREEMFSWRELLQFLCLSPGLWDVLTAELTSKTVGILKTLVTVFRIYTTCFAFKVRWWCVRISPGSVTATSMHLFRVVIRGRWGWRGSCRGLST